MDMSDSAARKRYLYHFTHSDNVQATWNSGYVTCDAVARDGLMRTEVGDPDIKESRRRRAIPIHPGGCVGDYVPFYFAPRSPMMYPIACDHRDRVPGRYAGGDRPLVYLVTTVGAIADTGLVWVATDGNAATATTDFTADLRTMEASVDWPLMKAERWNNTTDDPDRQRRRMAEFLVRGRLPVSLIRWYGVFDEVQADRIRAQLADHLPADRVIVRPHWYYGFERR